jgi:hypothetical protein
VFTVFSLYIMHHIYRYLKMKRMNVMAYTVVSIYFIIYITEAFFPNRFLHDFVKENKNYFALKNLPDDYRKAIDKINEVKNDYQCLVTLPFYHEGTENFGVKYTDNAIFYSMILSYWTNTPLMNSSAARSPIIEGKNIMQFFSPPWFKKDIEQSLPNKKPFLLCYDNEPLNPHEQWMLDHSQKIFEAGSLTIWNLPYDKVFNSDFNDEKVRFNLLKDSLLPDNGLISRTPGAVVFHNDFNNEKSDHIYRGGGAYHGIKRNFNTFITRQQLHLQADSLYTLSFWSYNKDELRNQVLCIIEFCDPDEQNCTWDILWSPKESMVIDGDWSLVEKTFKMPPNKTFAFSVKGDDRSDMDIYIDDLLLQKANSEVYSKENGEIIKNNIRL